jgi:hypothetical protein
MINMAMLITLAMVEPLHGFFFILNPEQRRSRREGGGRNWDFVTSDGVIGLAQARTTSVTRRSGEAAKRID